MQAEDDRQTEINTNRAIRRREHQRLPERQVGEMVRWIPNGSGFDVYHDSELLGVVK